jgi:hypothetical protein
MSDIRFDGEESYAPRPLRPRAKGLAGLVVRWGLAKNERSAQLVLLAAALIAFLIALALFMGSAFSGAATLPPPAP